MSYDAISYKNMGGEYIGFPRGTMTKGTDEGKSCYLDTDGLVKIGAADKSFLGTIASISDTLESANLVSVRLPGGVTTYKDLPYTGTDPIVGSRQNFECGAAGVIVIDATNGRPAHVLAVDATNDLVTLLF